MCVWGGRYGWIHGVFSASVCILIFDPTDIFFLVKTTYISLPRETSDGQVTISSFGVPVLFHASEGPNKLWGRQAYPGLKRFRLGSPAWVKKFVDWETDITPGAWPFNHFACSVTSPEWPPVSDVPSVASWLSSHDTLHHLVSLWGKQSAPQNRQATPSICFLEILPKGVGEREFNIPTFHFAVRIHLYYFDIPPILGHIGV